jgi:hypothetical protein
MERTDFGEFPVEVLIIFLDVPSSFIENIISSKGLAKSRILRPHVNPLKK